MRLFTLMAICVLCGCGTASKQKLPPAETSKIRALVEDVAEYQSSPQAFKILFDEGAVPNDTARGKLHGMTTRLQNVQFDDAGTAATADVTLESLLTREVLGPVQWKLVKKGDKWKISTFALPSGPAPAAK